MPGILCEHCVGYCCRHIALPIETPREPGDYDDIRWYLLHTGVTVFVEDGTWYLHIETTCRHLQPDFRCGIYDTRPQICRDYSTDNCDYHSGDYGWEHHFAAPEHLDAYVAHIKKSKHHKVSKVSETARKNSKTLKTQKNRNSVKSPPSKENKVRRPRLRAVLRPADARYLVAATDVCGVRLPILGAPR